MRDKKKTNQERREWLKLMGGGMAFATMAGLAGCSDGGSEPSNLAKPSSDPKPQPKPAAKPEPKPMAKPAAQPEPMADMGEASPEPAAQTGGMPQLAESDPQAQALGYKKNTSDVDASRFPTHNAEQKCSNCLLYSGNAGNANGPCGIFPGRSVNAEGWCSAYSKKA